MKIKDIIVPGFVLFVICLVTSVLLAVTNEVTAPKIAERQEQAAYEAMSLVLPDAKFDDESKITLNGVEYTYNIGKNDSGETVGYVFTTVSKGYGGDVKVMTGVNADGTVSAIETLELNETAGLGMKAAEQNFKDMFKGKSADIGVVSNGTPGENEIKALTGATITTNAVTDAVNTALSLYNEITGGAK
ncbi:MAG: RnfABCDGE type electron transport complex subunit G [Clostridia bacterium]|nr:RnfABCDGE type electron transport complex subunit G [Clostridia bacterium]